MKKIKYHAAKILPIALFLSLSSCHGTEDDLYPNNSERTDASRRMSVLEYPDIYEILKSEKVILEALNAWKEMLTYATHFSRREIGFFIYYRHSSNSYFIGEWVYGPLVPFTFGNCLISRRVWIGEWIFCPARQKSAGILTDGKDF